MKTTLKTFKLLPPAFMAMLLAMVLIIVSSGNTLAQQSTPFLEDWEGGGPTSGSWNIGSNTNTTLGYNATAAYNGSYGLYFNGTTTTGYVTPADINEAWDYAKAGGVNEQWTGVAEIPVDLSGLGTDPQLKFYYSMGFADNNHNNNLWVAVTDATTDTTLLLQRQTPGQNIDYLPEYLDLSPWVGQAITVHFIYNGRTSGNYLYLDDIEFRNEPLNSVDWCNLRRPRYIFVPLGQQREVFARVFETGRTELPDSDANIQAWIGLSEVNTDPATWSSQSWRPAYFYSDVPATGDDEYSSFIGTGLDTGTYYYASRFQIDDGPFSYGGVSADPRDGDPRTGGFWDGIHNVSGVLQVDINVDLFPYTENFDVDSLWYNNHVSFGWVQETTDDFDWTVGWGSTPTANTGPAFDHTQGDTSGNYLFIEATGNTPSQRAVLTSLPFVIDGLTNPIMEIWYNMYGNDIGEFSIDVWDDQNGWTNDVFLRLGDQGEEWERAVIDLSVFAGDTVKFRFNGITGTTGDGGDIAIDDFYVGEPYATDYAIADFFQNSTIYNPFTLFNGAIQNSANGNSENGFGKFSTEMNTNFGLTFSLTNLGNTASSSFQVGALLNTPDSDELGESYPPLTINQTRTLSRFIVLTDSTLRGTFTADLWISLLGGAVDVDPSNNTARLNHVLIYPENNVRQHYDDGDMDWEFFWIPVTQADSIEFAMRYTVEDTMILSQFDLKHNFPYFDLVEAGVPYKLKLYRSSADTTMPGTLYYMKSYTDSAYFSWSNDNGAYVTLPIDIDSSEIYYPGDEFWVGININISVVEIQLPQIAVEDSLTDSWYRSYYNIDGGTWTQLASGVPSYIDPGFIIRAVGIPYSQDYFDLALDYFEQTSRIPDPYSPLNNMGEKIILEKPIQSIPVSEVSLSDNYYVRKASDKGEKRIGKLFGSNTAMPFGNTPFSPEGFDSTRINFHNYEFTNIGTSVSNTFNVAITTYTSTPQFRIDGPLSPINPGESYGRLTRMNVNFPEVGTFASDIVVTSTGDVDTTNNRMTYEHTLVYPKYMIREHIDLGNEVPESAVYLGPTNEATAIQRLTAPDSMLLSNIDVYLRTDGTTASDTVFISIYAEGADSLSMGSLLFSKAYTAASYLPIGYNYISYGLPADSALGFLEGEDFWVVVTANGLGNGVYGLDLTGITEDGRSFISNDRGATYSTFTSGGESGHWMIRAVGTAYIPSPPVITTIWERNDVNGTLPPWFSNSASTERGLAFGYTASVTDAINPRLFAPSRNSGTHVYILDGYTGTDVGELDVTGVSGGLFAVSDAEVTSDGIILVCNMTLDASTSPLKVYYWGSEGDVPTTVLTYSPASAIRLGDKFTVRGNWGDGTAVAWFGASDLANVLRFRQQGPGLPFDPVPEIIPLDAGVTGASATAGPLENAVFYWNAGGQSAMKYDSTGLLLGTVSGGVVPSGANSIKFLGMLPVNGSDREHFLTFQGASNDQNARLVELPSGDTDSASTYVLTPQLGTNSNPNGTGDVDFWIDVDGTAYLFVLATNNGIGCYKTTGQIPVELTSFTSVVSDRDVELRWNTASEVNSSEFVIERALGSGNGLSYKSIGSVDAAGNSAAPHSYSFIDEDLQSGTYSYRLKMVDNDGSFTFSNNVVVEVANPEVYELTQNYPNPFNPATKINYSLPFDSNVKITIYNALGEMIEQLIDVEQTAGFYTLDWNAAQYASGVYFYTLTANSLDGKNDFRAVKKMMLLK